MITIFLTSVSFARDSVLHMQIRNKLPGHLSAAKTSSLGLTVGLHGIRVLSIQTISAVSRLSTHPSSVFYLFVYNIRKS